MTEKIVHKIILVGREACLLERTFKSVGFEVITVPTNLGSLPEGGELEVRECSAIVLSGFGVTNLPMNLTEDSTVNLFALRTNSLLVGSEPRAFQEGNYQRHLGLRSFLDPDTAHLYIVGFLKMELA